jgi:alpha/beta superfamily hydrolase
VASALVRERQVEFSGRAGLLEGRLGDAASHSTGVLLALHPHSLYGGSKDNNVVEAVVQAGQVSGSTTLRFNFRGVGLSEGSYDNGVGEQDDVGAALDFWSGAFILRPRSSWVTLLAPPLLWLTVIGRITAWTALCSSVRRPFS